MLRTRDFYFKKVYSWNGKKIGVIEDLTLDFFSGKIMGFTVSNFSLFNKKNFVNISNIVSMNENIIVTGLEEKEGLPFKELKYLDVISKNGEYKGVLEDLIIDKGDFTIRGIIISSGIFDRVIKGKEVILINECILAEGFLLYKGNDAVVVKTLPHSLTRVKYDEII